MYKKYVDVDIISVETLSLRHKWVLSATVALRASFDLWPLPALAYPGDGVVDARHDQDQPRDQDHTGDHQRQHVARRGPPLVTGRPQKLIPAVQERVGGAEQQRHMTQFRLRRQEVKRHMTQFRLRRQEVTGD